jgi:hypothetical protein
VVHLWFFDLDEPKDQNALDVDILLIQRAFEDVLGEGPKSTYLSWFKNGLGEYLGNNGIAFGSLKKIRTHFSEKAAEKIPRIAFDATEGRLGGELFDSVAALIMTTLNKDQTVFASA